MAISTTHSVLEMLSQHGPATAYADDQHVVTYEALAGDVGNMMRSPVMRHVGPGARVAWCPTQDYASLVTFWSIFSLGATACPLSPKFPPSRKSEIATRLRAVWLDETDAVRLSAPRAGLEGPHTVILSSGSSGDPKAVVHTLEAHIANAIGAAALTPLHIQDRWLWSLPCYHVSGLSILIRCAVAGACVVGCSPARPIDANVLRLGQVTHLSLVTTQLRRLLPELSFPGPCLRHVLLGGSSVPASLLARAVARGVPVHVTYGMTETASQIATSAVLERGQRIGATVLPHCDVKIASEEILVRSESLCLGYDVEGQIETTTDAEGWFATGDRGCMTEDGRLMVWGRMDNMFISGGENVYPEAIERELLELPQIEQVMVVARDDAEFGARPVAFVTATDWDVTAWTAQLRSRLRSFEIPVEFRRMPDTPQMGIKPNRAQLQAMANS